MNILKGFGLVIGKEIIVGIALIKMTGSGLEVGFSIFAWALHWVSLGFFIGIGGIPAIIGCEVKKSKKQNIYIE